MMVGMGNSGKTYAGGCDFWRIDLGLLTCLRHSLYDVVDGGVHSHANVICGFSSPFSKDFIAEAEDNRATIGSTSINTQPELINRTAQHSKLFFNSVQLNYDISGRYYKRHDNFHLYKRQIESYTCAVNKHNESSSPLASSISPGFL
jgi:hypothetical protein